jgi:hypothetical protein
VANCIHRHTNNPHVHSHSVYGNHPHYQSEDISFRRSGKFQHCPPPAPWLYLSNIMQLTPPTRDIWCIHPITLCGTSNAFLGYLCNTLYSAATHTKALHILERNLPGVTTECQQVRLPSWDVAFTNSASSACLSYNREGGSWNKSYTYRQLNAEYKHKIHVDIIQYQSNHIMLLFSGLLLWDDETLHLAASEMIYQHGKSSPRSWWVVVTPTFWVQMPVGVGHKIHNVANFVTN